MALRRFAVAPRRGLILAAPLAAAFVAVLLLPPRPVEEQRWSTVITWDYWRTHRDSLSTQGETDVKAARGRLQQQVSAARRADSALALAQASAWSLRSADGLISVLYEPPLSRDAARRLLQRAERELALYPADERPGVPTLLVTYADSARHRTAVMSWWSRRQYVRVRDGEATCVVELNYMPLGGMPRWRGDRHRRPLGACALYARYGLPGRADVRWRALGITEGGSNPWWGSVPLADAIVHARRAHPSAAAPWEWTPSGMFPVLSGGPDPRTWLSNRPNAWRWSACLAHGGSPCLKLDDTPRRSELHRTVVGPTVVARLLVSGGGRRFGQLWRSDAPTEQAIEAAYGKPADTVVREALLATWLPSPHGPRVTFRAATASLAWLVVALGIAVLAGIRRQARG